MRNIARIVVQVLIGVFFVWHALSVSLYAIPMISKDPLLRPLRDTSMKLIAPYMLSLSQWQQWNLFSPDPLRHVTQYRIERQLSTGQWEVLESLTPAMFGPLRLSTHFKMYIGMLERDSDTYRPAVLRHFLLAYCESHSLPSDTPVRLIYSRYSITKPSSFLAAFHADPWPPHPQQESSDPAFCD